MIQKLKDPITRNSSFRLVVSEFQERLYWQIRRMVNSHEDANDILQNSFVKAWKAIDNFREESNIYTWLHRIVVNETLTFLDKQKRMNMVDLGEATSYMEDNMTSEGDISSDHIQHIFQEALKTLPERQRIIFSMRYFDELKFANIADALEISEGAVKASYHIAANKIKDKIKESDH